MSVRDAILAAARRMVQARGYHGLNFRHVAEEVGIKAASIYHHFPGKAELGAAVARRYREDTDVALQTLRTGASDPKQCLEQYPLVFRRALEPGNRLCLASFMAAETDDLPEQVKREVQTFAEVNIAWLGQCLVAAEVVDACQSPQRAGAIYAAIVGAQLLARSRGDTDLFDNLINGYRVAGLLPMAAPTRR